MLIQNRDKVLFIGDSVTDSGRKYPIGVGLGEGVGNGFVRVIDTLLNVIYPENMYNIVNMGISGNTTKDLLARWQTDALDLKPDVIVCEIGVNDVWRIFDDPTNPDSHVYLEENKQNLKKIIDMSKGKCRQLIFMTPYYMELNLNDAMSKTVREYASAMKELSEKNGIMCIDLQKDFDEYLKYRHSSYVMNDRVHPGPIGCMIIARAFLRAIGVDRELL